MIDRCLLKVDLDTPFQSFLGHVALNEQLVKVEAITGLHVKNADFFKSNGGNTHLKIWFREELEPLEKLFLQCWLGDDRLRCLFNFRRIRRGQVNWNILFGGGKE